MRKVYLSFLGLGSYNQQKQKQEYKPAVYEMEGRQSGETEFVQVAEMELLGGDQFDLVVVATTQTAHDAHFQNLSDQMRRFGVTPVELILEEDMKPEGQWRWFERILAHIEPEDRLFVDLTHGYRAIPIVFSTAINFLQKARDIRLEAVFYGVWEKVRELGYAPIVDMKQFYLINEWADAVSRLVEDADARKMSQVAEKAPDFQAGELNDPEVIRAFDDLTDTIRNVDINHVARKASYALSLIKDKSKNATATDRILLDLVINKFVRLATQSPYSGKYDRQYFEIQIEIIGLLLEHKLFMQAYTVMREFIASIGMIPSEQEGMSNRKRKKRRQQRAEVFVNMFQKSEKNWCFTGKEEHMAKLMPFYERLKQSGIEATLRDFAKDLADYRNGFDHAWTGKPGAYGDIESKGQAFSQNLKHVLEKLKDKGFFDWDRK